MEMQKYIDGFDWDPRDPPNAALIVRNASENEDMIVVELTNPQYDKANQALTYTAKVLDDYEMKSEWLQELAQKADHAVPEQFGQVALVIDDFPSSYSTERRINPPARWPVLD